MLTRVETAILLGARGVKGGLGHGVVLGVELKDDLVADISKLVDGD
jgi:hypothetical protein